MGVQSALGYEFRRPNPFQRATQRLEHHHHTRPAAVGTVVHAAVPTPRVVARVPDAQLEQTALEGPSGDAVPAWK